jgi:3-deoxy-D-manno-octulosonic-acid transferase
MSSALSGALRSRLLIYNLLFPFALAGMLPRLLLRMIRRGNYRRNFGQRFGQFSPAVRARLTAKRWTWIHSISVGETILALKLIRKMKELDPELNVVLSATTSTGFALASEAQCDWLEPIYNPLDSPAIVTSALSVVRPERLIFVEALWPNLLAQARRIGIPTALIARLSPRSERRFQKFRWMTQPLFRALNLILVQESEDVERWTKLGAEKDQVRVTGNIKFDSAESSGVAAVRPEFHELLRKISGKENPRVLLGGSTFPGEEKILADVYRRLRQEFIDLFLILVPRHVERAAEVLAAVNSTGLRATLRTSPSSQPADCLIVDTTGELRDWYPLATIVFIGKSLTSTGGQNPVEPVLAGKPVVFGPHMENFRAIVERWLRLDAARQINDAPELEQEIATLLRDQLLRGQLVMRARSVLAAHEGATQRTAELLLNL